MFSKYLQEKKCSHMLICHIHSWRTFFSLSMHTELESPVLNDPESQDIPQTKYKDIKIIIHGQTEQG